MSSESQGQQDQYAAIYGAAAKYSEHQPGQPISFTDPENGEPGEGTLLYVASAGQQTHEGGPVHPSLYIVDAGSGFPKVLYLSDIKGEQGGRGRP